MGFGSTIAGTFLSPSGAKLQHRTGLACRGARAAHRPNDASPWGMRHGVRLRRSGDIPVPVWSEAPASNRSRLQGVRAAHRPNDASPLGCERCGSAAIVGAEA